MKFHRMFQHRMTNKTPSREKDFILDVTSTELDLTHNNRVRGLVHFNTLWALNLPIVLEFNLTILTYLTSVSTQND